MKYILKFDGTVSELEHILDERFFDDQIREVLKLRFLHNYTYERIAEEAFMSSGTIKKIIYCNLPKLQKIIDEM